MQTLINQVGTKVFVPDEWKTIFPNLFEGKEIVPPKFKHNDHIAEPTYWIERAGGGYGDVMHMLSAIENKIQELQVEHQGKAQITVSVPQHHLFLLNQIRGKALIHSSDTWTSQETYFNKAINGVREFYDICCPCADYELVSGFDVRKSRIEIFHETLGVKGKVTPPILKIQPPKRSFPVGKKIVGIGLQSTDKWRNWNLDRFSQIASWLQKKGYFVVTIDHTLSLAGIPGIAKMPIRDVIGQMAYLDGFIGLDSGLTYLAAALGTTTVGLYGETNGYTLLEKHYLNGHAIQVIRKDKCVRPCYLNRGFYCNKVNLSDCTTVCMAEISVRMVQEAWELLEAYGTIGSTRVHKGE